MLCTCNVHAYYEFTHNTNDKLNLHFQSPAWQHLRQQQFDFLPHGWLFPWMSQLGPHDVSGQSLQVPSSSCHMVRGQRQQGMHTGGRATRGGAALCLGRACSRRSRSGRRSFATLLLRLRWLQDDSPGVEGLKLARYVTR